MPTLTALDLFAGAGGLGLGLSAAGFDVITSVEWNRDAAQTLRRSAPSGEVIEADVRDLSFHRFAGVDVVAGGPPCQPFSTGGKQRSTSDERDMIPEFIRAVAEVRPRAFVMENVPGLMAPRCEAYLGRVLRHFVDLGYLTTVGLLDAADFGVPQSRRRLLLTGLRGRLAPATPEPTHGVGGMPRRTAGDVLRSDVGFGEPNRSIVTYARNPDLRPNPYHGHLFNGGGRPIDLSKPAPTILASAGGNKTHFVDTLGAVPAYHAELSAGGRPRSGLFEGGRRLSIEESAALQTFPASTRLAGSRSSQYTQVGNAVPPVLAEAVARAVLRTLA